MTLELKGLGGIQQNRDGAIVYQFHFHHFLEAAGLAGQTSVPDARHEVLVELASPPRRRGGIERWPLATANIAVQRKLRDHQNSAADGRSVQVHLSVLIFEHAQSSNLAGQIIGVCFIVCVSHAEQNQQTAADIAHDLAAYGDLRMADTLYDGSHKGSFGFLALSFKWHLPSCARPGRARASVPTQSSSLTRHLPAVTILVGLLGAGRSQVRLRQDMRQDSPLHRFVLAITLLIPFTHSSGGGLLWLLERNRVFAGDRKAFDTFKKNYRAYLIPEKGQQGTFYLHPNEKGAQVLGRLWSEAIAAALSGSLSNVGGQE